MMHKKIHKLVMSTPTVIADMPHDAEILYIENQSGFPTIWYLFLDGGLDARESRQFQIFGTGQEIPLKDGYLGSCICDQFVWHVFEVRK